MLLVHDSFPEFYGEVLLHSADDGQTVVKPASIGSICPEHQGVSYPTSEVKLFCWHSLILKIYYQDSEGYRQLISLYLSNIAS